MLSIPTVATSSSLQQESQKTGKLLEQIPEMTARFQKNEGTWLTSHCQHLQVGDTHFYGIHKNQQLQNSDVQETRKLYQSLKGHLLQIMGLSADTPVIQVVGDSASFSTEGTEHAKSFLRTNLPSDAVVLYGYTGHAEADGNRCVNAAVSDVIEERQSYNKTIANLVGFHTPAALKGWGCTGPELKHYMLVYGDDESNRANGTVFGDDVITSDFFADSLLACEGGAQSFRQICNALLLDQKIHVIAGLRSDAKGYVVEGTAKTPYFAAAQFLTDLSALKEDITEDELQIWFNGYFGQGKCYIADPKKPDFDTKHKLLTEAWDVFVKNKLHLKISKLIA